MSFKQVILTSNDFVPFSFILQEGIGITVQSGCTLKQLLFDNLGITNDYIEKRIKTVFINQKPVDDYETAIVYDKDVIGLSGAMPGLVGATLRNNSVLSSFRSNISYKYPPDRQYKPEKTDGLITLKIFNILIKEMGQVLLENGILIQAEFLHNLLATEHRKKESAFKTITINGNNLDWKKTGNYLWNINKTEMILLVVKFI